MNAGPHTISLAILWNQHTHTHTLTYIHWKIQKYSIITTEPRIEYFHLAPSCIHRVRRTVSTSTWLIPVDPPPFPPIILFSSLISHHHTLKTLSFSGPYEYNILEGTTQHILHVKCHRPGKYTINQVLNITEASRPNHLTEQANLSKPLVHWSEIRRNLSHVQVYQPKQSSTPY